MRDFAPGDIGVDHTSSGEKNSEAAKNVHEWSQINGANRAGSLTLGPGFSVSAGFYLFAFFEFWGLWMQQKSQESHKHTDSIPQTASNIQRIQATSASKATKATQITYSTKA